MRMGVGYLKSFDGVCRQVELDHLVGRCGVGADVEGAEVFAPKQQTCRYSFLTTPIRLLIIITNTRPIKSTKIIIFCLYLVK